MPKVKLSCFDFGRKILEQKDLDPVYVLLHHSEFSKEELQHWLLAYWCFYHVGTASWIMDKNTGDYWTCFMKAAASKDWPRCPERRHFRGNAAIKYTTYLQSRGVPDLFEPFSSRETMTAEEVMKEVKTWAGFGPWIAFKVADMLERLGHTRIDFSVEDVYLFDSPKEGARRLREELKRGDVEDFEVESWAVTEILNNLGEIPAPPGNERAINAQEAETILCKWKSYTNGHYTIGEDIKSCRSGLLKFASCRTSQKLIKSGKIGGLW